MRRFPAMARTARSRRARRWTRRCRPRADLCIPTGMGQGRLVESSMRRVAAALRSYLIIDKALFPEAGAAAFNAPTGLFPTRDGHIYVSMLDDAMFRRLSDALGMAEWRTAEDLQSSAGRIARAAQLNAQLAARMRERTTDEWMDLLQARDILCGRVRTPHALLEDPQACHLGLFAMAAQPGAGSVPLVRLPGQPPISAGA